MKEITDPRDVGTVLRCRTTKRYFTGDGWSDDLSQALIFPNEAEAVRACSAHNLQDAELVVWAPATRTEVVVAPLQAH